MLPIEIEAFVKENGEDFVLGYTFFNMDSFYTEPMDSKQSLDTTVVSKRCSNTEKFSVKAILSKVMARPLESNIT